MIEVAGNLGGCWTGAATAGVLRRLHLFRLLTPRAEEAAAAAPLPADCVEVARQVHIRLQNQWIDNVFN